MRKYTVLGVTPKYELWCEDEGGAKLIIDPHTDRGYDDVEEFSWKEGDVFFCEVFPYIPLYFARYKTIKKGES